MVSAWSLPREPARRPAGLYRFVSVRFVSLRSVSKLPFRGVSVSDSKRFQVHFGWAVSAQQRCACGGIEPTYVLPIALLSDALPTELWRILTLGEPPPNCPQGNMMWSFGGIQDAMDSPGPRPRPEHAQTTVLWGCCRIITKRTASPKPAGEPGAPRLRGPQTPSAGKQEDAFQSGQGPLPRTGSGLRSSCGPQPCQCVVRGAAGFSSGFFHCVSPGPAT